MKIVIDWFWSGIFQFMVLVEVLKIYCSVVLVYLVVSYYFRFILNGRIFISDNLDNNIYIFYVLWSRDGIFVKIFGFMY